MAMDRLPCGYAAEARRRHVHQCRTKEALRVAKCSAIDRCDDLNVSNGIVGTRICRNKFALFDQLACALDSDGKIEPSEVGDN